MNRIKVLRLENGWTQEDLARRISAVKSTVSRYESETAKLDPETIASLCQIFGVTADYLLGFSSQRMAKISDADAALVDAYHAAPESVRAGIDALLQPYKEQEGASVASAG